MPGLFQGLVGPGSPGGTQCSFAIKERAMAMKSGALVPYGMGEGSSLSIRRFILITLTHAEKRSGIRKGMVGARMKGVFVCRAIIIATEAHKEEVPCWSAYRSNFALDCS